MLVPVAHGQSVDELQAQISALLAQIQTLQSQLTTLQGDSPAPSLPSFTSDLTVGSKGDAVSNLQTFLKNEGADVYPEGLVTGYFGSLTKAAVMRYQDKYADAVLAPLGLSSGTGYFGAGTRAHVNSRLAVATPPPSVTPPPSTTPPPSVTPPPEVTPPPSVTPPPAAAAGLTVALDSGNPSGSTLVADLTSGQGAQVLAEVLRLKLTNGDASDAKVTSLKLHRIGVSADSDFANAYLYDGATRLSDSASVTSAYFTFSNANGLFTVPAGGSKSVSLKVDLANGATSGKTFQFGLMAAGDVTANATVNLAASFHGNEFRTAQASDLGQITLTNQNPSGATNVDAGTTNYEAWRFSAQATDQKVELSYFKFTLVGTADYDALQNFKLHLDGVQVGSSAALMNSDKTLVFDLSGAPVTINAGVTKQVSLRADVMKGSGRTFRFRLAEAVDVVAKDLGYGVNIKANQADVYTLIQGGGDTTINSGSLTITKSSDSQSSNIALTATGVKLATFDWKAVGEDIKVSTVTLQIVDGANSFTNIRNVKLLADGLQVGTTAATVAVDTNQAFSAGSSFVIKAGTTKKLDVYADVQSASGAADAMAGSDTFTVRLIAGSANALRQSAGTTLDAPGSNADGNSLTVSAGTVSGTLNSSIANMTVVENAQNQLVGSWLLTAPTEQAVDVTSLTLIDRNNGDSANAAYGLGGPLDALVLKSGGTQYGQTINSPSTVSGTTQVFNLSTPLRVNAGQSIQIDLYANILSNANARWTDTDRVRVSTLTATGIVTNSSVSLAAAVNGQAVTVSTGAVLTMANEVSPTMPTAGWLVSGDTGVTLAAWKFSADNTEDVKVTRVQVLEDGTDDLPGNAKNIKLYVDGVQVGSTVPAVTNGSSNTALFENTTAGLFTVPRNSNKTLVLKVDLTDNTNATFSADGSDLRGNLNVTSGAATATTNVSAKGATSGAFATLAAGVGADHQGNNFKVVKTRPVFALCETEGSGCAAVTSGETLVPGTVEVFRFSVTAHSAEDVVFNGTNHNLRLTVTGAPSAATAYNFDLYDASTNTTVATQVATATASGGFVDFSTVNTTVPKGTTKTYYVKAALNNFSAIGNSFQLSLKNAAADVSFSDGTASADLSAANFVGWGLPLDGETLVKP
ncbi:MAG: hypothetical protein A2939_04055 [Parcubacteria group bacterium RIFCSPLOWO2_01_FULL_48_18]|nr:MAG: hypothetical protein A2939_04055 [Parcubacteria group bacterium RIFCSPLOWO2_01_FULL_48_18]